jgi:hypothetical protein
MSDDWETFCDSSYFDLWRVRRKNERGFNDGYHLQNGEEAKALVELLNRVEMERDEARAERDQLKEALLIMENLLKPGIELFPEIGQFLKGGIK